MTPRRASVEPDQHQVPEREPAADLPVPRQAQTSPQRRGAAAAGNTSPVPGELAVSPSRGGTGDRAGQEASARDEPSESSSPLAGKAGRDAWKAAQSAHNAAQRRGRAKRAPKQAGPGMIRRLPPETPGGAA